MGKEPIYSEKDINVIDDAISLVQRLSGQFVGDTPTGAKLVSLVVSDLILLDAGPLRIARSGSWYSICATRDWLMSEGGVVSFEPFRRLVPMPSGGRLYDRAEVILTALSD